MPNTPFDFDFLQTFFALCDVTAEAYKKILQIDEKYLTKGYFDIVTRIDTNIKKIISSIIKEIDFSVRQILAQEFNIVIRCLIEE
jgi:fructose-1,6-bisphosphatase/inositol monophosphatase family enzyme